MKKLTAGIFATLLAVVSADSAYAAIASQGYVDDKVGEVETTVAGKADSSTVTALAGRVTTAEGEIDTLQTTTGQHTKQIGTINTTLSKKLDSDTAASTYQTLANKTTSVSGDSTDTQYPSAKAVWTAVQSVDANASVEALEGRVDSLETNSATKTELATKQNRNMGSSAANSIVTTDGTGNITASATIAASKVSGLANVATSGAYSDLSGKPTIPTVDAAITEDSTNAVQSGAVYDALATKANSADIPTTVAELTDADNYALVSTMNTELGKKQNSLTETQLNAVNSGITTTKVATYDGYAGKISANTSAIATKADADDVTDLTGRVAAVEAPKATVAAGVTGPVSGGTVYTAIQGVSGDVSGVTSDVETLKTDMTQAKEDISALEAASATHATQTQLSSGLATKQDKLTQTGSANQPVYVDATGKVTAGNTIPAVTTNIATGQTGAAQAGAVATALAAKANSTDVYTKSAADDAFIPRPSANCTATGAKCVLVTNGTGFEWEVIVRGDEE